MDNYLILSIDYEIFGNGQGYVKHCVLDPAERMIRIAERYQAPLTFFVEALEFMVMERALGERRIQAQVAQATAAGHDAQLHLHPQWWDAVRGDDGAWRLDMRRWRIGDLEPEWVITMVGQGKEWLEALVDRSGYRCIAFRAGGWCIQPAEGVLRALRRFGILIDSTVAPGLWNATPREWCDFRDAPSLPFWTIRDDVCIAEDGEILELPIATGKIARIRHLKALKESRVNGGLAPGCEGTYQGPDGLPGRVRGKLSKLARLGHVMLDFSTMPAEVLIDVTRQWIERYGDQSEILPIVAIAHTKNFTPASEKHLTEYLEWAERENIIFSTYGQWLEAIRE